MDSDCSAVREMNRMKRKESRKAPALEGKPCPRHLALHPTGEAFWPWNAGTFISVVLFPPCCFRGQVEGCPAGQRKGKAEASWSKIGIQSSIMDRQGIRRLMPHLSAPGWGSFQETPSPKRSDGSPGTRARCWPKVLRDTKTDPLLATLFPQMAFPGVISQSTYAVTQDGFRGDPTRTKTFPQNAGSYASTPKSPALPINGSLLCWRNNDIHETCAASDSSLQGAAKYHVTL